MSSLCDETAVVLCCVISCGDTHCGCVALSIVVYMYLIVCAARRLQCLCKQKKLCLHSELWVHVWKRACQHERNLFFHTVQPLSAGERMHPLSDCTSSAICSPSYFFLILAFSLLPFNMVKWLDHWIIFSNIYLTLSKLFNSLVLYCIYLFISTELLHQLSHSHFHSFMWLNNCFNDINIY